MATNINRIKAVLADQQKTGKWLAKSLGVNVTTVSKWCTNKTQPDLYKLNEVANLLKVDIRQLLIGEYPQE